MKKSVRIIAVLSVLCIVFAFSAIAFANQENELEVPHEHSYQVVSFANGTAFLECELCDSVRNERFDEYINDTQNLIIDMNNDGIVNAKDYAILLKNF